MKPISKFPAVLRKQPVKCLKKTDPHSLLLSFDVSGLESDLLKGWKLAEIFS
jgi:hypothetical protein